MCKDTVVGESLGIRKELQEGQYAQTQGTRDGYKASVRVGESPSETLECHADAFVYILRPKGSYSKVLKRLVIVM